MEQCDRRVVDENLWGDVMCNPAFLQRLWLLLADVRIMVLLFAEGSTWRHLREYEEDLRNDLCDAALRPWCKMRNLRLVEAQDEEIELSSFSLCADSWFAVSCLDVQAYLATRVQLPTFYKSFTHRWQGMQHSMNMYHITGHDFELLPEPILIPVAPCFASEEATTDLDEGHISWLDTMD